MHGCYDLSAIYTRVLIAVHTTASSARLAALPDVPIVQEFGYRDYEVDIWYGLAAPAKTPKESLAQLADWFTAAMQVPEARARLALQGLDPAEMCGTDFAALMRAASYRQNSAALSCMYRTVCWIFR